MAAVLAPLLRRPRLLNIVDEFTREALVMHCERSITAEHTVSALEALVAERGAPQNIRCDNGPELTANALRDWCRFASVTTSYHRVNQLVAPRRGDVELVDAFDERALAIAASCAAPNTRRAYATAYRAFACFLRDRYGVASRETFTLAAVAAWRDELAAQGLAPSSVAQRVSAPTPGGRDRRRRPGPAGALHADPARATTRPLRPGALPAARTPGPPHHDRGS